MTSSVPHSGDPMPEPPQPPDLADCCASGCDPCIFDLHDRAMDRYRQALRAWQERHPAAAFGENRSWTRSAWAWA